MIYEKKLINIYNIRKSKLKPLETKITALLLLYILAYRGS